MNFSYVLFLLHLHCCTDCIDNRPGASAVRSLPEPLRFVHAAFLARSANLPEGLYILPSVISIFFYTLYYLPLCQLLKLNDDDEGTENSGLKCIVDEHLYARQSTHSQQDRKGVCRWHEAPSLYTAWSGMLRLLAMRYLSCPPIRWV